MNPENLGAREIDATANPAPLGLAGFGMATVLLNLHNAGLFELGAMILAMGIFYGGLAQIIAGAMEWKKGNTFGTTAFISYGLFWLSLAALIIMPQSGLGETSSPAAMSFYFLMWGIFTFCLFLATLKMNRAMQFIFGSLTLLFLLLVLGDITGNAALKKITGIEGIICGVSAIYTAMAQILNEAYGRIILPLGTSGKNN